VTFLNLVDNILKIPGGPRASRNFEFEKTKADFVFITIHAIKHQDEGHAMGGSPVIEGLSESGIVIAPELRVYQASNLFAFYCVG